MKRCEICNGYAGDPRELRIGDKCNFTVEARNGRGARLSVRVGKLAQIYGPGNYLVIYRNAYYSTDKISHLSDPSPLSLAMFGRCACDYKTGNEKR